jgi:phosphatidylserine decarboxylase
MQLARASVPYLAATLTAALLCWLGAARAGDAHRAVRVVLLGLFAVSLGFTAAFTWFFRDPERVVRRDEGAILAPGDGTVRVIHKEGRANTIEIFLALWNVHIQRAPVTGTVVSRTYRKGAYLMAYDDGAGTRNTRCTTVFRAARGRVEMVQVAGWAARKVECWLAPGQRIGQGERMGIIHMGSQVRVTLPASAKILVKPGDRVAGGLTPVARWR